MALAPGDPLAQFAANPNVPPEVREMIRVSLGLDQPWHIRYVKWLLGESLLALRPRRDYIRVSSTSRSRRSSPACSSSSSSASTFGGSLSYDSTTKEAKDFASLVEQLKQSIMPIAVLTLFNTAGLARFIRAEMLEHLPLEYVRTARAKGITERLVILRHVLRNSLIPVVTLIALGIPAVFAGAIVTEQIFRVPGLAKCWFVRSGPATRPSWRRSSSCSRSWSFSST